MDELTDLPEVRGKGGMLTLAEGQSLHRLARDKFVLEIGSWCGCSALCMAKTARKVHCVDWGRGDGMAGWSWVAPTLLENLRVRGALDTVCVHVGRSVDVCELFRDGLFDLVFVDGAHDFESVCADLAIARRVLAPGGTLAMHDVDMTPVRDAMDRFGIVDGTIVNRLWFGSFSDKKGNT